MDAGAFCSLQHVLVKPSLLAATSVTALMKLGSMETLGFFNAKQISINFNPKIVGYVISDLCYLYKTDLCNQTGLFSRYKSVAGWWRWLVSWTFSGQPHNYKWCMITYHQSSDAGRINCLLILLLNTLKLPLLFPFAQISGSKSSFSITWHVHSPWSRSHQHLKVPAAYCSKISETTAETEPKNIDSLRSLNILELLEYDCIYRSRHAWKVPSKWFPFRFWFM